VRDVANGPYTTTFTASDGTYCTSVTFTWSISSPILIMDPGIQNFSVGSSITLPVQANDSTSGTLTYIASGLPSGVAINPSTGVITGTISNSTDAVGSFNVQISVTDGSYSAVQPVVWNAASYSLALGTVAFFADDAGEVQRVPGTGEELKGKFFKDNKEFKIDGGGIGTVKLWLGVDAKAGDRKLDKKWVELEFIMTKKPAGATAKDFHWVQLFKSAAFVNDGGTKVAVGKDTRYQLKNKFWYEWAPEQMDVDGDKVFYDAEGIHRRPPSGDEVSVFDSPEARVMAGADEIQMQFDDVLVGPGGKPYYYVHWTAKFKKADDWAPIYDPDYANGQLLTNPYTQLNDNNRVFLKEKLPAGYDKETEGKQRAFDNPIDSKYRKKP
jgi:hypothetical protein